MPILGLICLLFGIIVILYPAFIAYIIGFFFFFIGLNILLASWIASRGGKNETTSWKVAGYEIIKNRR